jgi:hypothetical protein
MVIDICNVEKKIELNIGDVIVAKHKIKTDKMLYYKLIEEGRDGVFRLLNLGSSRIMATFASKDPLDAVGYIEIACKAEILDIVPVSKLKLTTVSSLDY